MSWLADHTGIHISPHRTYLDKHQFESSFGNLAKNVSPFLAFTPLGALGAGALGGLGEELRRGGRANLGQIARAGISNAAIGQGMKSSFDMLHHAFAGPAANASDAGTGYTTGAEDGSRSGYSVQVGTDEPPAPIAGGPFQEPGVSTPPGGGALPDLPSISQPSVSPWDNPSTSPIPIMPKGGLLPGNIGSGTTASPWEKVMQGASGVGGWMAHHPEAVGQGLQGIGAMSTSGAENRYRNAQADQIEFEMEQERRRNEALAPLRAALGQQISNYHPYQIAPNPYAGGGNG